MKRNNKGITLISLVITIVVLLIISSTVILVSAKKFKINEKNKMYSDISILSDRISSYYLKYNELPILKDENGNKVLYTYTQSEFNKNQECYIIDLEALGGISLYYGDDGLKNPNYSDDVYVINEENHNIYYARGIELDKIIYYNK